MKQHRGRMREGGHGEDFSMWRQGNQYLWKQRH